VVQRNPLLGGTRRALLGATFFQGAAPSGTRMVSSSGWPSLGNGLAEVVPLV